MDNQQIVEIIKECDIKLAIEFLIIVRNFDLYCGYDNVYGNKYSLLHHIAHYNSFEIFQVIMEHVDVDFSRLNEDGETFIHYSIIGNNFELFKYIIEHHPEQILTRNDRDFTPFDAAIHNPKYLELMLPKVTPDDLIIKYKYGNTLLHKVVKNNLLESAKLLLAKLRMEDRYIKDANDLTPLELATSEEMKSLFNFKSKGARD